jgi:pimeloyl-ACP methyl ester carboxylesterase
VPPSIRFCRTADGASIAYAVDGDGPPLLLPAWWVSHVERNWEEPEFRAFMTALAREHTVVRYDRPGVGLSDRRRTRYTLEEDAAAFAALADHLGYERFSLLGISCGGPLAIDYATRNPERIARIVVYGSSRTGRRSAPRSSSARWSASCARTGASARAR